MRSSLMDWDSALRMVEFCATVPPSVGVALHYNGKCQQPALFGSDWLPRLHT